MRDIAIIILVVLVLFVCFIPIFRVWYKQARKKSREQRRKQGQIDPISRELINLVILYLGLFSENVKNHLLHLTKQNRG